MSDRPDKGKSVILFPDEYVCVDTETTGLDYDFDEVIEISAVRVHGGKVVDKFTSLIKPSQSHFLITVGYLESLGYSSFSDVPLDVYHDIESKHLISDFIEDLTGITNDMLLVAPSAKDVIPRFVDFIATDIIVGHNVNFDINFLYDDCEQCGLTLKNDFVDTMRIARKLFPDMPHHRLSDVAEHLGIAQETAHRAEADALVTTACYEAMKQQISQGIGYSEFQQSFNSKTTEYRKRLLSIAPTVDTFDETNPLFDKALVFTGALSKMTRKEAFQLVANLGGYPQETITKDTNFLVVGSKEFADSVKNGRTAKMKKADKYKEKGQDIVVLSENTFFQMLQ